MQQWKGYAHAVFMSVAAYASYLLNFWWKATVNRCSGLKLVMQSIT